MVSISKVEDNVMIWSGTVFRIYNVNRIDIMKTKEDRKNPQKIDSDYYELLLFDANILEKNSFCLVNITVNSNNAGKIFAIIPEIGTRDFLYAKEVKKIFGEESAIKIML